MAKGSLNRQLFILAGVSFSALRGEKSVKRYRSSCLGYRLDSQTVKQVAVVGLGGHTLKLLRTRSCRKMPI